MDPIPLTNDVFSLMLKKPRFIKYAYKRLPIKQFVNRYYIKYGKLMSALSRE